MLIKYTKEERIEFEDTKHSVIKDRVLKMMQRKYPTDNFQFENFELSGYKYYDTDKGYLFTGEAIVEISQSLPYGQEPSDSEFVIRFDY